MFRTGFPVPIVLIVVLSGTTVHATPPRPAEGEMVRPLDVVDLYPDDPVYEPIIEATIASAHLFPIGLISDYGDDVELVSSNSVILIVEYIATWWLRAGIIYNLPVTPETVFVRGVIQQTELPSRLAIGLTWSPLYIDFAEKSRVEFQALTYMGLTLEETPQPVPVLGGRIVVLTDATAGVGVYFGFIAELVINQIGPIYGVGYRF